MQNQNKNPKAKFKSLRSFFLKLRSIPLPQKIFFTQNLKVMLKSGLSLSVALKTLAKQTQNKRFKIILEDLTNQVEKGTPFAKSLALYPDVFSELFINMIASGEVSGKLEKVLGELTNQMKRDHALLSKIKGAMIYPAIVIAAMIGIGTLMVTYVIPKITSIFKEVEAELPLPTKILLGISDFVVSHGFWVVGSLVIIVFTAIKIFKTQKGRNFLHLLFLKFPIIGSIIKKINLARFSRTLSSLLKTDIPIVQSLEITAKTLGNVHFRQSLEEMATEVKKGVRLQKILSLNPELFPPVVTQMVAVGEESGSLDFILEELASFYEEEIDNIMKNLPSIIEPLLILALGVGVACMAVAVLMPMYSLTQQF